jgi:hypothetical protein
MVDALEAAVAYLYGNADLNVLTAGRIAVKHKFGDGWAIPSKALQLRYDGGTPDLYTERQVVRLEARCYGESQYECSRVFAALNTLTRNTQRERVETTNGAALLYWLLPTSGPSFLTDPDAGVDVILIFLEAAVSEVDIP